MGILRAGDLDRKITIQKKVQVVRPGMDEPQWIDVAPNVWASKMDITGRERIAGVTETSKISSVFRIRS